MFKPAKLYIPFLYIEKQARGSLLGQTYSLALKRGGLKKESEIIGGQCMRDTCCHCKVKSIRVKDYTQLSKVKQNQGESLSKYLYKKQLTKWLWFSKEKCKILHYQTDLMLP